MKIFLKISFLFFVQERKREKKEPQQKQKKE
jgi:hypothetical protein